jgi:hypothetical protein
MLLVYPIDGTKFLQHILVWILLAVIPESAFTYWQENFNCRFLTLLV